MKKFATLLLILCSATATAKTAYVTDELEITLRTGETTGHRIVRMLPTGEKAPDNAALVRAAKALINSSVT